MAGQAYWINSAGASDLEETRAAFDPPIYERLIKLKTHYDPHQLLQPNHPITPPR